MTRKAKEADPKLEALRCVMYHAYALELSRYPQPGISEGEMVERLWRMTAEVAFRFLGCEKCPSAGAVADVIATLEALLTAPITKGTCIMARSRVVELLTALKGESG